MASKYTKLQQESIKMCLLDCDIMGLSIVESINYIRSRVGIEFSVKSYQKYKEEYFNDESNTKWITYYARQGFVEFYRKRIAEMEMIQKETFRQWLIETSRPDSEKNKELILKLVSELRSNNQQLTSLGMVTPIIATIKNLIDKDKLDNATRINNLNPIEYQTGREIADTGELEVTDTTETKTEPREREPSPELDNNYKF